MNNYNEKRLMKKVTIAIEKSMKRHLERKESKVSSVVQLTNWRSKVNIKKYTSKERNQIKETCIKERRDIILNEQFLE